MAPPNGTTVVTLSTHRPAVGIVCPPSSTHRESIPHPSPMLYVFRNKKRENPTPPKDARPILVAHHVVLSRLLFLFCSITLHKGYHEPPRHNTPTG